MMSLDNGLVVPQESCVLDTILSTRFLKKNHELWSGHESESQYLLFKPSLSFSLLDSLYKVWTYPSVIPHRTAK